MPFDPQVFKQSVHTALARYDENKGILRRRLGDAPPIRELKRLTPEQRSDPARVFECFLRYPDNLKAEPQNQDMFSYKYAGHRPASFYAYCEILAGYLNDADVNVGGNIRQEGKTSEIVLRVLEKLINLSPREPLTRECLDAVAYYMRSESCNEIGIPRGLIRIESGIQHLENTDRKRTIPRTLLEDYKIFLQGHGNPVSFARVMKKLYDIGLWTVENKAAFFGHPEAAGVLHRLYVLLGRLPDLLGERPGLLGQLLDPAHARLFEAGLRNLLDRIPVARFTPAVFDELCRMAADPAIPALQTPVEVYINNLEGGHRPRAGVNTDTHTRSVNHSAAQSSRDLEQHYGQELDRRGVKKVTQEIRMYLAEQVARTDPASAAHGHSEIARRALDFRLEENDPNALSGLTTGRLIQLLWVALEDETRRQGSLEEGRAQLRQGLYESHTEYTGQRGVAGLDGAAACKDGCFHKLIEVFTDILPDCHIILMTFEVATLKFHALVKEKLVHFLQEQASTCETAADYSALKQALQEVRQGEMPDTIWEAIKPSVREEMLGEFSTVFYKGAGDPKWRELEDAGEYVALDPVKDPSRFQALEALEATLEASKGSRLFQGEEKPSASHPDDALGACGGSRRRRKRGAGLQGCRLLSEEPEKLTEAELLKDYEHFQRLAEETTAGKDAARARMPVGLEGPVVSRVVARANEAYQAYQLVKAVRSGDPTAVAWSVGALGIAKIGSEVGERVALLGASRLAVLRGLSRCAPLVGTSIAGIPMIIGLVQDIKRLQAGDTAAVLDVVADSVLLTITATEAGMLMLGLEVGPEGTVITLVIMLGMDIVHAAQVIAAVEQAIPLSLSEEFREGWRVFVGSGLSEAIQDAQERADLHTRQLAAHVQRFYTDRTIGDVRIGMSALSLGQTRRTKTVQYTGQASSIVTERCWDSGMETYCDSEDTGHIRCATAEKTRTQWVDSDDGVHIGRDFQRIPGVARTLERPLQAFEAAHPDLGLHCIPASEWTLEEHVRVTPGRERDLFTAPRCPYPPGTVKEITEHTFSAKPVTQPLPHQGLSHCDNALVIGRKNMRPRDLMLVTLGNGNDQYHTDVNQAHLLVVGSGKVQMTGSASKNDTVLLTGCTEGTIDLRNGTNTADFSNYCPEDPTVTFTWWGGYQAFLKPSLWVGRPALAEQRTGDTGAMRLHVDGVTRLLGRQDQHDEIEVQGFLESLDGQGGKDGITLRTGTRLNNLVAHAGDQITLQGELQPIYWSVPTPAAATEPRAVSLHAQAMTAPLGSGTHLIAGSEVRLDTLQALAFDAARCHLSVQLQGQPVDIFYPPQNTSMTAFGFVTTDHATFFPFLPPCVSGVHPGTPVQPLQAGLLYVAAGKTEKLPELLTRLQSLKHPTLGLVKHAQTVDGESVMVGSDHAQVFDIPEASGQKYYVAGRGSNTYVIRSQDQVTIALSNSSLAGNLDLLDLSSIPMAGMKAPSIFSMGEDVLLLIPSQPRTTTVLIKHYHHLAQKLTVLESLASQYYRLPRFSAFPTNGTSVALLFDDSAHLLRVENPQGITSLAASQLSELKYSAIHLPMLQADTWSYYRAGAHLLILGENAAHQPLGLLVTDFYAGFLKQFCGRHPCQLSLRVGEGDTLQTVHWSRLHVQARQAPPYTRYLQRQHAAYFQTYRVTGEHPVMHITLPAAKIAIIDVTRLMAKKPKPMIRVQHIDRETIVLQATQKIAGQAVQTRLTVNLSQPMSASSENETVVRTCLVQLGHGRTVDLLEVCQTLSAACLKPLNARLKAASQVLKHGQRVRHQPERLSGVTAPSEWNRTVDAAPLPMRTKRLAGVEDYPARSSASRLENPVYRFGRWLIHWLSSTAVPGSSIEDRRVSTDCKDARLRTLHACQPGAVRGTEYVEGLRCTTSHETLMLFPKADFETCAAPREPQEAVFGHCRPVEWNHRASVVCEGENTTLIGTPDVPVPFFDRVNACLLLGRLVFGLWNNARDQHAVIEPRDQLMCPLSEAQRAHWQKQLTAIKTSVSDLPRTPGDRKSVKWLAYTIADREQEFEQLNQKNTIAFETIAAFHDDLRALQEMLQEETAQSQATGSQGQPAQGRFWPARQAGYVAALQQHDDASALRIPPTTRPELYACLA